MGAKKDPKATSKTPAKTPKKKEGGGGKAKKKKWSKGKTRDKLNNLVLFDKVNYSFNIKVQYFVFFQIIHAHLDQKSDLIVFFSGDIMC